MAFYVDLAGNIVSTDHNAICEQPLYKQNFVRSQG